MGLDQYMYRTKRDYNLEKDFNDDYDRCHEAFSKAIEAEGGGSIYDHWERFYDYWPDGAVRQIWYGRKENAIHRWFVVNAQGGEDDCRYGIVPIFKLKELRECLQGVLDIYNDPKLKELPFEEKLEKLQEEFSDKLPTQSGFFFGSTEYDHYYIEGVKNLHEVLTKILDDPDLEKYDYYYHSSW